MFVDRQQDLHDLNTILARKTSQFVIVSGRRRVGKTTLLLEWARRSGLPFMYWVANRSSNLLLLQSISQALWRFSDPGKVMPSQFTYDSWTQVFERMAQLAAERKTIFILDELPYIIETDSSLTSQLQNAWDHHLKNSQICLLVAGSHIAMMNELQAYQAPLYGRFTAQVRVDALPFHALRDFFPRYDAATRVAVYAILGGIPAYLEQLSDDVNLRTNLDRTLFERIGMFHTEPTVLIGDLVREPRNYSAIIQAIAADNHTREKIASVNAIPTSNVGTYLARLAELQLIDRRTPATLPPDHPRTTQSRYYLRDPFLRFYYRFIEPHRDLIELGLKDALWQIINDQIRAFIGLTTFEDLCREWTLTQARAGRLPFVPYAVSSHWDATVQVDVAAVSWREKAILLGECKWTGEALPRNIVAELIEQKTPKVLASLPNKGEGWRVHYAFFSRNGFTPEASALGQNHHAYLIDLDRLDADLTPAKV